MDGAEPTVEAPFHFSLIQVPVTGLPVPPSHGESPRLAWLLEPANVVFSSPPGLSVPDSAGLSGEGVVGVLGYDPRLRSFRRPASLSADGDPGQFHNQGRMGPLQGGVTFVNIGYQSGRATIKNGSGSPGDPVQ